MKYREVKDQEKALFKYVYIMLLFKEIFGEEFFKKRKCFNPNLFEVGSLLNENMDLISKIFGNKFHVTTFWEVMVQAIATNADKAFSVFYLIKNKSENYWEASFEILMKFNSENVGLINYTDLSEKKFKVYQIYFPKEDLLKLVNENDYNLSFLNRSDS